MNVEKEEANDPVIEKEEAKDPVVEKEESKDPFQVGIMLFYKVNKHKPFHFIAAALQTNCKQQQLQARGYACKGKAPSVPTRLVSSAITTIRSEASATTFS